MPSPSTWLTVPSKRCTASIMVMQGGVQELLGGLRVEILDELGRVFDVGEQHRDLLAFAFQGAAGGQDLLGEIRWGVGQRRPAMVWSWCGLRGQRVRRCRQSRPASCPPGPWRAGAPQRFRLSESPAACRRAGIAPGARDTRHVRAAAASPVPAPRPRQRSRPLLHSADSCLGSLTVHHIRTRDAAPYGTAVAVRGRQIWLTYTHGFRR